MEGSVWQALTDVVLTTPIFPLLWTASCIVLCRAARLTLGDKLHQLSRTNPLELLAGLDDDISARGSIFLDDGETVDTVANGQYFLGDLQIRDNTLTMTVVHNDDLAVAGLHFERIVVLGFREPIRSIIVNGDDYTDWTFSDGALSINNLSLQVNDNFEILFL